MLSPLCAEGVRAPAVAAHELEVGDSHGKARQGERNVRVPTSRRNLVPADADDNLVVGEGEDAVGGEARDAGCGDNLNRERHAGLSRIERPKADAHAAERHDGLQRQRHAIAARFDAEACRQVGYHAEQVKGHAGVIEGCGELDPELVVAEAKGELAVSRDLA